MMPKLCLKPYKQDLVVMIPQKTFLKQMYENFNAPSTESLDSIFNRLQKIVSQLAILGENISQKDINMKFLRRLPSEWNTNVVVWRNKANLDTMSIDDLYNNFKIAEQEVKRTVTTSSSSESQNMAFLPSLGSTNEVDTANIQVSTVSTPVITVSTHDNTANLSDATVFKVKVSFAEHKSKKVDCFNCHKMRHFEKECRSHRNQESRPRNQNSLRKTVNVKDTPSKSMVAIDGAGSQISDNSRTGFGFARYNVVAPPPTGLFAPPTIDLSNSSLEEFQHPEFKGYEPKASKCVCVDTSNEIKKAPDAPIIEDWVFDSDEDESKVMVLKFDIVQHKPEQANQPRKHLIKDYDFHDKKMVQKPMLKNVEKGTGQREVRPVLNNTMRINHQNFSNSRRIFAPTAVLTKSGIVPISTASQSSSRVATPENKVPTVVGKQGVNVVKSSDAGFEDLKLRYKIMSPKTVDHTFGDPQNALKDQGYFDNGCSRNMTGNISYLTDFKEHDGGYVAFGG
nr:hypothetical protein [Tanacetum cinerariifolium]